MVGTAQGRLSPTLPTSIQPKLGDQPRRGLQFATLDALDEVGQRGVGVTRQAKLLAFARHKAIEEFDFGPAALLHVLAHRGSLRRGCALGILEALRVARPHRRLVALARARDRLGGKMQDLLELIAERLANPDRFAAKPRGEAAD